MVLISLCWPWEVLGDSWLSSSHLKWAEMNPIPAACTLLACVSLTIRLVRLCMITLFPSTWNPQIILVLENEIYCLTQETRQVGKSRAFSLGLCHMRSCGIDVACACATNQQMQLSNSFFWVFLAEEASFASGLLMQTACSLHGYKH